MCEVQAPRAPTIPLHYALNIFSEHWLYLPHLNFSHYTCGINPITRINHHRRFLYLTTSEHLASIALLSFTSYFFRSSLSTTSQLSLNLYHIAVNSSTSLPSNKYCHNCSCHCQPYHTYTDINAILPTISPFGIDGNTIFFLLL